MVVSSKEIILNQCRLAFQCLSSKERKNQPNAFSEKPLSQKVLLEVSTLVLVS